MQHPEDIIVITAAGKGTWLRERLTPSAWVRMFGEGMMTGYKEKMQKLREVDDRIYDWLKDLDKIAKQMRKAAKAARFVDVAILLAQINKRLQEIKAAGKEVKTWTDEEVLPFELEHKEELPSEKLFADDEDVLTAEAGLSDLKRKWVARRLETEMRRTRKLAIKELLDKTEKVVDFAQGQMSALSKARASGDIATYIRILNEISKAQTEFQNYFMPVYRKHLEPLVQKAMDEKKKLEEAEAAQHQAEETKEEEKAETKKTVEEAVEELHKKPQEEQPLSGAVRRIHGPQDLLPETSPEVQEPALLPEKSHGIPEAGGFVGLKPPHHKGVHTLPADTEQPVGKFVSHELTPEYPNLGGKMPSYEKIMAPPEAPKVRAPRKAPAAKVAPVPVPAVVPTPAPEPGQLEFKFEAPKAKATRTRGPKKAPPVAPPVATANTELEGIILKTAHRKFMSELFKAADQNDPYLIAAMLLKYAEQIEDVDLEKSLQLTAIAEGILDES